ncbi:hypothetical protein [Streptosporangium amethystogenes]|uniref:hypothetical protein n=1 Tax=Streptosporangium amethystogenes TaxID=2002 RepID=UPI0012F7BB81|nr:hypothetical protein [Streptosporangium amethystogenes]
MVSRPMPSGSFPYSPPGSGRSDATSGDGVDDPGAETDQVRESGGLGTIPVRQIGGSAGPWRPDRSGASGQTGTSDRTGASGQTGTSGRAGTEGRADGGVATGWPGASQRPGVFGEPGAQGRPAGQVRPGVPSGAGRRSGGLLMRIGDIPIRVAYSLGAAVITGVIVVLIFVLFSGDEPSDPVGARRSAAPTAQPSPTVSPITLPALPDPTALKALPGTPSVVLGAVTDTKSAVTYASLGKPWAAKAVPSFSAGQQVGPAGLPRTVIASGPLPGATPAKPLKSDADYRKAALSAVKWTIRNHHPEGGKVTWTASQRLATGKGWVLAYRVTYEVEGKERTSRAALAVIDVGRRKPSVLFVTVPDTRKRLWADIAPVMASVRAL